MKTLIGLSILLVLKFNFCNAQQFDADAQQKGFTSLTQSGKLLNLLVEPSAKKVRLQIVGKDTAVVRADDTSVEAFYGLGELRKRLKVVRSTDPKTQKQYFMFERTDEPLENLEIKVKSGPTSESFSIPHL